MVCIVYRLQCKTPHFPKHKFPMQATQMQLESTVLGKGTQYSLQSYISSLSTSSTLILPSPNPSLPTSTSLIIPNSFLPSPTTPLSPPPYSPFLPPSPSLPSPLPSLPPSPHLFPRAVISTSNSRQAPESFPRTHPLTNFLSSPNKAPTILDTKPEAAAAVDDTKNLTITARSLS